MKMNKKKALISAALTIVLCLSIIAGGTFALFTSSYTTSIAVTSANVDVLATLDDTYLETKSLYEDWDDDLRPEGQFELGGTATLDKAAGAVTLTLLTPGDAARFKINVTNESNVPVQYRVYTYSETVTAADGITVLTDLTPALEITASMDHDGDTTTADRKFKVSNNGDKSATLWQVIGAGQDIGDITVTVDFPDRADNNDYKNAAAKIYFVLEAVQANGKVVDYVVTEQAAFQEALDTQGIITTEGQTVATDDALWVSGGTSALVDAKLDGTDVVPTPENTCLTTLGIMGEGSITVGDGTEITAPVANGETYGMFIYGYSGESNITVTKDAKIYAKGENACAIKFESGTANLVLEAQGLIVTADGADGIVVGAGVTLNIYTLTTEAYEEYKSMVVLPAADGTYCTVNYYVNGTLKETVSK